MVAVLMYGKARCETLSDESQLALLAEDETTRSKKTPKVKVEAKAKQRPARLES